MPARDYRDLIAWKKALELSLAIYQETSYFPKRRSMELHPSSERQRSRYHQILPKGKAGAPKAISDATCPWLLDH